LCFFFTGIVTEPSSIFVAGDPTTVYNLLEILDGLLDFMMEQIDPNLDSGGTTIPIDFLAFSYMLFSWKIQN